MKMVNVIRFRGLTFVPLGTALPRIVVVRYVCPKDWWACSDVYAQWRKCPSQQWHTLLQLRNLFQLGRLDIIIQILCTRSVGCAVEAAGVLAQLTNPTHALIKLNDSSTYIIARLLGIYLMHRRFIRIYLEINKAEGESSKIFLFFAIFPSITFYSPL